MYFCMRKLESYDLSLFERLLCHLKMSKAGLKYTQPSPPPLRTWSIENENKNMATMMSAYILSKAPHIESVVVDSGDEIQEIHFL